MSEAAQRPAIVLTDPPPLAAKHGRCPTPQCKGQKIHSAGFGRVAKEVCSACGHVYGEVRIG